MVLTCMTGDDTGLVKRVGLRQGQELHRWGVQAAGVGVCRLSWGAGDDEGVCGAGMQTGAVRFWDTGADADSATYSATCEYAAPADSTPAAVVGLRAVGTRVVACDASACVRVWQWAPPTEGGGAADAPLLSFQAGKRAAAAAEWHRNASAHRHPAASRATLQKLALENENDSRSTQALITLTARHAGLKLRHAADLLLLAPRSFNVPAFYLFQNPLYILYA